MVLAVQILPRSDFSKSEPPIKAERLLDCENEYPIAGTFRVQQRQPSQEKCRADALSLMAGQYQAKGHHGNILPQPV